ncbi:hypothetical protein MLD38_037110 [Melastoma candidum]|uniref:Uncharacterized protein n=1 Tax=Melastoma candidum TaxID=119954 RepID=A0ACB9LLR3_9MYRT|nr:hypothetical protein MLD38_037110 [Melastoma candidum]
MPALRMRNKPSSTSSKETNVLCVCKKSYKISKKSFSDDEITEERFDSDNCSQHSCTEVDFDDIQNKETESGCQHLDINNAEVDQQLLLGIDSTSSEDVENISSSQHDTETFFSPVAAPKELSGSTSQLSLPVLDSVQLYGNKSSCDYQTRRTSDFYISDVIIASIPPHGDAICKESDNNDDDDTNEMKSVDYRSNESDDADTTGKECSSSYLPLDEIISGTSESQCNSEIEDTDRFDPQWFIRTLRDLSIEVTSSQSDPLRSSEEKRKSVTLVLDLDETLCIPPWIIVMRQISHLQFSSTWRNMWYMSRKGHTSRPFWRESQICSMW